MKNKSLIAVWGNNGAGKSLISCAVANKLTAKGKSVIVMSFDKTTPMFRSYLPTTEDNPAFSIGKLQGELVTLGTLKNKIHIHPQNGNLGFMAYVQGDSALTYQESWRTDALQQLVSLLVQRELANYIVIDCTSDILDSTTLFALVNAATSLIVSSPDCRSISFASSAEPVVNGNNLRLDRQILVLNNVYDYSPATQMVKDWGFQHTLPHSPSAYKSFVGGQLIHKLEGYEGYAFEKEIEAITQKVVKTANE